MQLFYNAEITSKTTQVTFDKTESRHIVRVLRKNAGDTIYITNGNGQLFTSKIEIANDKKCLVFIVNVENFTKHWNYYLHIAIAPTKLNDRFEWFLEKATEIGVDEITPIICERSERKIIKTERMQRVIESAMKQSLQTYLPKLNEPIYLSEFLKKPSTGLQFIAHCEDSERHELKRRVAADQDLTILIGPEGDFSPNEIESALKSGYSPIAMGKTRLRTETAAIVACTIVAMINNG